MRSPLNLQVVNFLNSLRKKLTKSEFFIDLKTGSPLEATKNININKVRP